MAKGTSLNGKRQLYKYELLTNFGRSRWLGIGQVLSSFLRVYGLRERERVEVQKLTKNEEANIQSFLKH